MRVDEIVAVAVLRFAAPGDGERLDVSLPNSSTVGGMDAMAIVAAATRLACTPASVVAGCETDAASGVVLIAVGSFCASCSALGCKTRNGDLASSAILLCVAADFGGVVSLASTLCSPTVSAALRRFVGVVGCDLDRSNGLVRLLSLLWR